MSRGFLCLPVGRRGLPRTCLCKPRSLFRDLPEKLCCGFGMQSGARVLAELIVHVRASAQKKGLGLLSPRDRPSRQGSLSMKSPWPPKRPTYAR